jgi:hypothetical protein
MEISPRKPSGLSYLFDLCGNLPAWSSAERAYKKNQQKSERTLTQQGCAFKGFPLVLSDL